MVATIFFILVFGIIVYGFHFATRLALEHAAAEGARASIAGLDTAERINLARTTTQRILDDFGPLVTVAPEDIIARQVPGQPGLFEVAINYDFASSGMPTFEAFFPQPPTGVPTVRVIVSNGGY